MQKIRNRSATASADPRRVSARLAGSVGPSGTGVSGAVMALMVHDGALIAGYIFTTAGGLPSAFIAVYGVTDDPDIIFSNRFEGPFP